MVQSFLRRLLLATVVGCALVAPSWSKDGDATGSGALAAYIARPDASFALREVASFYVRLAERAKVKGSVKEMHSIDDEGMPTAPGG